ncbi:histidine phosphatase family protein [Glycomyces dulcitolivorans]|uniref:histidine phosphatase family protein n=1 Tax=Glycomyces dulcitolivorans TaxID=2200759 RepID=UPI000DD3FDA6|nr:histidine phosphatase family protein [Glycomyces dulcitolivorans]
MITTELVLVRHGQAECNAVGVVGGPATCTGLTDLGRRQVHAAATRLAREHAKAPFTALYAGPRRRLQETGRLFANALGLDLTILDGLDGPIHGEADGRPWLDVKTDARGGPHAHPDQPWAPGSDTWNGYLHRAGRHLADLLEQHDGDRVLFAAHGETIQALHSLLFETRPGLQTGLTVDHASLTRWQRNTDRFDQRRWLMHSHNDTSHLANLGADDATV